MPDDLNITMEQLQVGLYVHLDLKWFEHPFAFNKFRIRTDDQIKTIRSLGLKTVRYDPALSEVRPPPKQSLPESPERPRTQVPADVSPAPAVQRAMIRTGDPIKTVRSPGQKTARHDPARSEVGPQPKQSPPESPEQAPPQVPVGMPPALAVKRAMIERIRMQREAVARIEKAFVDTAKTIRDIEKNLFSRPAESVGQAMELVGQIVDSILSAPDLAIHIMGDTIGGEELYFHSLNVTMLSLTVARDIKLSPDLVTVLGMGALFHDIGRRQIPDRILAKTGPLTRAERSLYESHCQFGVEIGERLQLSPAVLAIIREHHELCDGTGFPGRIKGESIGLLSRIVAIANHYDELCNPANIADAMTPHEALSVMFARQRSKFDPTLLLVFVRCLGVYPPGTIVQLSNGVIGMVATINTARPMKPMLVIYDADIPKDEAILVDMEGETEVNIAKAIRPAQLPREIYNYLNPRKQVSYYFDAGNPAQAVVAG